MSVLTSVRGVAVDMPDGRQIQYPDVDIRKGDLIALEGTSGAGKTTLLRLLAGLIQPTIGIVTVRGCRIGLAFQSPRLVSQLSPLDNIQLVMGRRANSRDSAIQLLTKAGLARVMHQRSDTLSGGEAQRVNLLRALAMKPDLLLLDEVGAALDEGARNRMRGLLAECITEFAPAIIEVAHVPQTRLITDPDITSKWDLNR